MIGMLTNEEKKEIVSTLVIRRKKILQKLMDNLLSKVYQPIHVKLNDSFAIKEREFYFLTRCFEIKDITRLLT